MTTYRLGNKTYRPRTKENAKAWRDIRRELKTKHDSCDIETIMEVGGEEFVYYLTGRGSLIKDQG